MSDKFLVTGGAGFIGSNIARALSSDNEVVVVDDLSTGNISNIKSLIDTGKVVFEHGSVTDLDFMRRVTRGIDVVFHEAAIPSVPRSIANPAATHHANATGTLTCLIASRENRIRKLVYASSSSVYGDTPTLPKIEEMPPSPMSPYAASKLAGENYCRAFSASMGLKTACLRYFNVYGPRQDPSSQYAAAIPKFIKASLEGGRISINGDGTQTRDFTYVGDVVEANMLAAKVDVTGVFNIAAGRRVSVNDLVQMIIGLTGERIEIEHLESRPGDVKHSLADISRARACLGYSPKYQLEQGLKETVRYFSHEGTLS